MSNFKVDSNRLDQLINSSGNSGKTFSSPSSRDVSEFEKNMEKKENNENDRQEENQNPFESIFKNSFFSESKVQETQILTKTDMDFELTDKLVDRILVSDAKAGESEVRLQLGDNILKDTEISIKRLLDGSLEIKLNSGNYNSAQTLVSQQFELKSRLEKMENCTVTVEVNTDNQEEGNDTNKQSRGYFDFYNQEQN